MKTLLASFVMFTALVSSAAVLKDGPTKQRKEGIAIPSFVTLKVGEADKELPLVGSGVRKKSLLAIRVYLAEVFAEKPIVRERSKALDSINESSAVAVRTTFLRDVDAETIMNAFKDGFGVNKIDVKNDPDIKAFLTAVGKNGDGDEGRALTFVVTKNADGSELLVYEDSHGKKVEILGSAGLMKKIMSLWLGKTVDSKAQDMQNEILSGK